MPSTPLRRRPSDSSTVDSTLTAPSSTLSTLSAAPTGSQASSSRDDPTEDAYETLTTTSTTSSPRSHFSDETIDLVPTDNLNLAADAAGPPTTVPIIREDNPSPPPAYSLHEPDDSIWPTGPAVPLQPDRRFSNTALARRGDGGANSTTAETLPLNRSWAFNQGPLYGTQSGIGSGGNTLVQVVNHTHNNYGSVAVRGQDADFDVEVLRSGEWVEPRRVKAMPVDMYGRRLCRCCCCLCPCSRVTVTVLVMLVVACILSGGLGIGGLVSRFRIPTQEPPP